MDVEKLKKQGKKSRAKGLRNQIKSRDWILSNPSHYGVIIEKERVQIVKTGHYGGDIFAIKYGEKMVKDKLVDLKAGWDLIVMPDGNDEFLSPTIFLIQVKSEEMPDLEYMKALSDFKVPSFVQKELHIWIKGAREPKIIIL